MAADLVMLEQRISFKNTLRGEHDGARSVLGDHDQPGLGRIVRDRRRDARDAVAAELDLVVGHGDLRGRGEHEARGGARALNYAGGAGVIRGSDMAGRGFARASHPVGLGLGLGLAALGAPDAQVSEKLERRGGRGVTRPGTAVSPWIWEL